MIRTTFNTYKEFRVDWEINNPDEFIREIVLKDTVRTCLEKVNLLSPETGDKILRIPSDLEFKLRQTILASVLDSRNNKTLSGSITTQTADLSLCGTIHELKFSDNKDDPVQATVYISKNEYCYTSQILLLQTIVFYDPINKNAWIGNDDLSVSLLQKDGVKETICAFVKENMDKVFSDSVEAADLLVEIILQANGITLDTYTSSRPMITFRDENHVLKLPLHCSYLGTEVDCLPFAQKHSVLESTLLTALYTARKIDPAFAVAHYYVQKIHEDRKRDNTKFVQTFQKQLSASLMKAEEQYIALINHKQKNRT